MAADGHAGAAGAATPAAGAAGPPAGAGSSGLPRHGCCMQFCAGGEAACTAARAGRTCRFLHLPRQMRPPCKRYLAAGAAGCAKGRDACWFPHVAPVAATPKAGVHFAVMVAATHVGRVARYLLREARAAEQALAAEASQAGAAAAAAAGEAGVGAAAGEAGAAAAARELAATHLAGADDDGWARWPGEFDGDGEEEGNEGREEASTSVGANAAAGPGAAGPAVMESRLDFSAGRHRDRLLLLRCARRAAPRVARALARDLHAWAGSVGTRAAIKQPFFVQFAAADFAACETFLIGRLAALAAAVPAAEPGAAEGSPGTGAVGPAPLRLRLGGFPSQPAWERLHESLCAPPDDARAAAVASAVGRGRMSATARPHAWIGSVRAHGVYYVGLVAAPHEEADSAAAQAGTGSQVGGCEGGGAAAAMEMEESEALVALLAAMAAPPDAAVSAASLSATAAGGPSSAAGEGPARALPPVSRAYYKLAEAAARTGLFEGLFAISSPAPGAPRTGGLAIDVGASPGGWSQWLAQHAGATAVLAIDPADLAPPAQLPPEVLHVRARGLPALAALAALPISAAAPRAMGPAMAEGADGEAVAVVAPEMEARLRCEVARADALAEAAGPGSSSESGLARPLLARRVGAYVSDCNVPAALALDALAAAAPLLRPGAAVLVTLKNFDGGRRQWLAAVAAARARMAAICGCAVEPGADWGTPRDDSDPESPSGASAGRDASGPGVGGSGAAASPAAAAAAPSRAAGVRVLHLWSNGQQEVTVAARFWPGASGTFTPPGPR